MGYIYYTTQHLLMKKKKFFRTLLICYIFYVFTSNKFTPYLIYITTIDTYCPVILFCVKGNKGLKGTGTVCSHFF